MKTVDFKAPVVPKSKQENPKNENNRNNPKKSVTDKNAQILSEPIGQQQTGKKQKLRA